MKIKNYNNAKKLNLRKPIIPTATALSLCILSNSALAQVDNEVSLDTIKVEERTADTNPYAEAGAPYKAKKSGDKRHVKDLAETPKTITVITETQLKDAGVTDLRDIVASQPGITLGTGENGNAFGDRYVIRGHEARSDVFVDNLPDPGMTTRESFATEQIEITKGPSSTYAGRGSTGGTINSITKQASTEYDFTKLESGLGTDNYHRLSVDSNFALSDDFSVRINALSHGEDVPDRDPADKSRKGLALSGTYDPQSNLKLTADYYYLNAEDKPDLGVYIEQGGNPVDDVPAYVQEQDFLDSEVEVFTFRAEYDFASNLSIDNATRYGTTDNGYVVTGARGTTRDATDTEAPNASTVSLSTHQGWQEVEYFVNQTNIFLDTEIAGKENQFVFSLEYSDEEVTNGVYDVTNTGSTNCVTSGRGGANDSYCIVDANGNYITNNSNLLGRSITRDDADSKYRVETTSLGAMDTITFTDKLSVSAGLRADHFDYSNEATPRGATDPESYEYNDTLFNYHLGTVYQLTDKGNIYLTYSTSDTINGGESDTGINCGYGGLCIDDSVNLNDIEPEHAKNLEIGTKWNINDEKLLFSAAIFQVTKSNVMETSGGDYTAQGNINTGKNRVEGVELGLVGNFSKRVSGSIGATFMDSEILDSASSPDAIGKKLSNFADSSFFALVKFSPTEKFNFGASATYTSDFASGQPDAAAGYDSDTGEYNYTIPSSKVYDIFANYNFSKALSLRLNVDNVTNEDYYLASYRSGSFTYKGDERNAQLTLSYKM